MESSKQADGSSERAGTTGFDRGAAVTRSLLGYGVLVGPFYLGVSLVQAAVRDGFDLTRHALSLLANGPGGWVQSANLALSGLMVIAAAVGFARVLGPRSRGARWFLSAFGAGMVVAALFKADPMDGFPVGTSAGIPATISPTGMVHFAAGGLGFVCLAVACFFAAATMSRRGVAPLARLSLVCGLVVVLGFFAGVLVPAGAIVGIWLSVLAGWTWLAVLSLHLYRASPDPRCAAR